MCQQCFGSFSWFNLFSSLKKNVTVNFRLTEYCCIYATAKVKQTSLSIIYKTHYSLLHIEQVSQHSISEGCRCFLISHHKYEDGSTHIRANWLQSLRLTDSGSNFGTLFIVISYLQNLGEGNKVWYGNDQSVIKNHLYYF